MTIHSEHPFLDPDPDVARRLRGRTGVSLWTSNGAHGPAGLTVSSWMVAAGEPAYVVALLDPDADLTEALTHSRRATLHLLQWRHRGLSEMFAGAAPAPGGLFAQAAFEATEAGPRLLDAPSWATLTLHDSREIGWSTEVTCRIDQVVLDEHDDALHHRRGRYLRPIDPHPAADPRSV